MFLENLKLYNFRCYEQLDFFPDRKFNVIRGQNGQGKTSILEGIGLLTFLKSFRGAKNNEMLRNHTDEGSVIGKLSTEDLELSLAVKVFPKRKLATYNGKVCRLFSEYVSKISSVTFSPTDLEIIRGGPEYRRNWLDRLCQTIDSEYIDVLLRYNKILTQRNKYLKAISENKIQNDDEELDTWTDELIFWGSKVIHRHIHTVDNSVDKISKYYDRIANQKSNISIEYKTKIFEKVPCGQASYYSLELINQSFREKLSLERKKEQILGTTLVGPHRDDVDFSINANPIRSFASQGEVRSLVLALRLAEVEIAKEKSGSSPLLLIDDFSSELDASRRSFLLDYLLESDSQVFLTTTEDLKIGKNFLVDDRKLISV